MKNEALALRETDLTIAVVGACCVRLTVLPVALARYAEGQAEVGESAHSQFVSFLTQALIPDHEVERLRCAGVWTGCASRSATTAQSRRSEVRIKNAAESGGIQPSPPRQAPVHQRVHIGGPLLLVRCAELMKIRPCVQACIVPVVEHDAHSVAPDRFERAYLHGALARNDRLLERPVTLHFRARRFHAQVFRVER